ncbi:MAG: molybdopterin molybdotransferase MoeA [Gammaproteobacteria bacterium]|nr:molybdopterin molybdotransferase MoeA [Gammaproteobacteria bacterium]
MTRAPLLTLEEAQAKMREGIRAVEDCEEVTIGEALGRVAAKAVTSPIPVPGFDNSAMDGYAFASASATGRRTLPVTGRAAAGDPPIRLAPGCACRIFTGAPLPHGADTVVIQEVCERQGDEIALPDVWTPGSHIRRRGEDITEGAEIVAAGRRLRPQDIGLLASCGCTHIVVRRRLRAVLLTTGDELREPGAGTLAPGQIYDSNRPMLRALLAQLGVEVTSGPVLPDDFEATRKGLRQAAENADILITTGGVSVGEEDHVKKAVEDEGALTLWRVGIKPGKPVAFGHIGRCYFLGLPGNPVSGFVTFALFARPLVAALGGETPQTLPILMARAAFTRKKADSRREFLRARLRMAEDGIPEVDPYGQQSSGALSSTTWADGLIDIGAGTTVDKGQWVRFVPFAGLFG